MKTNLKGRTYLPGVNISILSHSAFSVIAEVQLSGFVLFLGEKVQAGSPRARLRGLAGFCWLVINNRSDGNETSPAASGLVSPSARMSRR